VNPFISVILCTRNRAAALKETLDTLRLCRIPSGWKLEFIVVDNGSTDTTAECIRSAAEKNPGLRGLFEPKPGLSNARNAGVALSQGEIVLFTDDDVRLPEDWIEQLAAPLLAERCEAVTGRITLAPDLVQSWMTPVHQLWLAASPEAGGNGQMKELIGANMGFRRTVLDHVPTFDPELGAGALGSAEDTLFGWQIAEAGFKIHYVPEASVEHHPDLTRLQRRNWLGDAVKRGRAAAYLYHHWLHEKIPAPRLGYLAYGLRLRLRRLLENPVSQESNGCAAWEMSYVYEMAKRTQFRLESRRVPNYDRRGLTRSSPPLANGASHSE
jgi:glycosyltransferase involved in cell wall biosynthesis